MKFQVHRKPTLHSFCGPVTALAIWSRKAVVGCGNEVSIHCLNSLQLETRLQILRGASIHGFSKGGETDEGGQLVCVYGAKQACVIALKINGDSRTDLSIVSDIVHLPDWIWEARWVNHTESNNTVAFALAHNTVALWDWRTNSIVERRDCVEKCILYCGHFIGDTWEHLVLTAGTVFNQVVLWLVSDSDQINGQRPAPVMHTFSGHKGVIFSIRYHAQHQRLCSVSDDRSIRMWQIGFPSGKTATPSGHDWRGMTSSLLLSVFGHSARVFDAVLMTRYFASVGEDAMCCIWDYSGQVVTKFKGHKGKCIWSVAATEDEQRILTGGGDGSVRMWKINTDQDKSATQKVLDVSKLLPVEQDDFPRTVTLLGFDQVLIMMNSGSFYCYSMTVCRFDCLFKDARFTSYSVVSPCPDKVKVAVASIGGVIKVLQLIPGTSQVATSVEKPLFDNKILAVVWVSHDRLVVSGQNGVCHILQITVEMGESDVLVMQAVPDSSLFLPTAKHRWVSAASFINTDTPSEPAVMPTRKLLACGDKDGTIHLYQTSIKTPTDCGLVQPCQSFHKIHGKNGVTHIAFHDGVMYSVGRDGCCRHWGMEGGQLVLRHGSKVVKGFEWIDRLECTQDGDLLFYGFFSTQFVIWSQCYNQKMFYVECGGGHRSWGCCHDNDGVFRFAYLKGGVVTVMDSPQCSRHEILKPPLHGRELHDVKLLSMPANAHSPSPSFLTVIASEDTSITVGSYCRMNGFLLWKPLATLKGHLSSVRALALSRSDQLSPPGDCDGDEDRNGIQSDFILFTGGGRAEIRVWKVQVTHKTKNTVHCDKSEDVEETSEGNIKCKTQSTGLQMSDGKQEVGCVVCTHQEWSTHYLGESRHKRPFSKWKTRKLCLDPETRVMSLDATSFCDIGSVLESKDCSHKQDLNTSGDGGRGSSRPERLHIVSAAGSDGLLRVFSYNDETRRLRPVAHSPFHQGCVLKVIHFHFKSSHGDSFLAFSTSTNGQIAVWSMDRVVRQAVAMENEVGRSEHSTRDKRYPDRKTPTRQGGIPEGLGGHGVDAPAADDGVDVSATHMEGDADFHPISRLPAHQSGINSLHALQINSTSFMLASGGDDNCLTAQIVKMEGHGVKVECHTSNKNAHSAQITGVRIVSDSVLVSSSIDQRICVWAVDTSDGQIKMELLSCSYISLADVSCMDVCLDLDRNSVYICLGGEGVCLYSWEGDQNTDKVKDTSVN